MFIGLLIRRVDMDVTRHY